MNPLRFLRTALRIALREVRSGVMGFRIFILVVALGVCAIATIDSTAVSLREGLSRDGRVLIGGDIRLSVDMAPISAENLERIESLGRVSHLRFMRTNARPHGRTDEAVLVSLKAVDSAYPLIGALELEPAMDVGSALAPIDGRWGALIERSLALRYALGPGDTIAIGGRPFDVRAIIVREPDRALTGLRITPRVILSDEGLDASGLVREGSLHSHSYRIALGEETSDAEVERLAQTFIDEATDYGWEVRTRLRPSPGLEGNIDRFGQFLTLIALATLIVGGVGVSTATRALVARKSSSVAIMASLGASHGMILATFMLHIMSLTLFAIALGLGTTVLLLVTTGDLISGALGFKSGIAPAPSALLKAAAYGLLISFAFVYPPLSRMRSVRPSALMRDRVAPAGGKSSRTSLAAAFVAFVLLALLAFWRSPDPQVPTYMLVGTLITFVLLSLIGAGLMWLLRRLPSARTPTLRLALANLARPHAMTENLILSLGIGVSMLVLVTSFEENLRLRLTDDIPSEAPSFFFQNVERSQSVSFDETLTRLAPLGRIETVPMLRGRIIRLGAVDVDRDKLPQDVAWIRGDRAFTYADTAPEDTLLQAGPWWERGYAGPPLVSLAHDVAEALDLSVGDEVVINVLGREVRATIANLRVFEWETLEINFVAVFSANTFAAAPHTMLKSLVLPSGVGSAEEEEILAALLEDFPQVIVIRIKDAITLILELSERLILAVRIAISVAVMAAIFVLAGACAANAERRAQEAAILRVLGANRWWLTRIVFLEFALLGLLIAALSAIIGTVGAYVLLENVVEIGFRFLPFNLLFTLAIALAITMTFGVISVVSSLGASTLSRLRSL